MKRLLILLAIAGCAAPGPLPPPFLQGAVASGEPHATEAGLEILRRGGNAVDAAVCVAFALAVTWPEAGNLGGGGFMMVSTAAGVTAIDYRETAPAAASRDMFLDDRGEVVPGLSLSSHKAAGVPGTVAGLWEAHRKFGSMAWAELVAPAIRLAEEGFEPDPGMRKEITRHFGAIGPRWIQADLARTLRRIAGQGRDGFYRGETARLIAEEMMRGGGLITERDLEGYLAKERVPVRGTYRGHTVVSMPPPSSGGICLIELLNLSELLPPAGHNSARYVHSWCEAMKRAYADRAEFLGDPDFANIPVERLVSKEYANARWQDITAARTDPSTIRAGERDHTTHFSVIDRRGNAVSNTYTLNDSYGSGKIVRGAGFLLNNEMDDFSAKPGVPNMFGVTGGAANAIAPGKRMLSSMSPTFVFDGEGRLELVVGSPGGPRIITTVLQVIVNRIEFGMTLAEAVAAPRFHHQWPPPSRESDPVLMESGRFPPATREELAKLGYTPVERGGMGLVNAIEIDWKNGRVVAVSDPRGTGSAGNER